MRGRAHNLFFRTERARAFEMRDHSAKDFRRGVREQALAQSFSQESAHERLSFVMRLNLFECGASETFKALTSEIHAVSFNNFPALSRSVRCLFQHIVSPARSRRHLSASPATPACRFDENRKLRPFACRL